MKTHNVIEEYLGRQSWEIKENSNRSFSLQGLNMMVAESAMSEYWLDRVYPKDVSDAHRDGDMHIHDLGGLSNYCTGWDLAHLLKNGLCGINGNNSSKPANHFRTALMHVVNFLYTIQNECMGAVAFSNVDTLLAPFIRADGLTYDEIKQSVQEFVFNINVPTRQGNQTPFTNISLDLTIPEHLKNTPAIVGGKICDFTYGDLQDEADLFNMAFAEIMLDGDADGRPFSFPIPTFNLTEDFDWENPVYNPIWEMTSKYGIPYFANFINSDMKPEDSRSMCCFSGLTAVVCKIDGKLKIKNLRSLSLSKSDNIKVPIGGRWVSAKPVKTPFCGDFYKVTLRNGSEYVMTDDHLSPTFGKGDLRTDQLSVGDMLKYNFDLLPHNGVGSYDMGKFIGLYLAEGSHLGGDIQFSLGDDEDYIIDFISQFVGDNFASHVCVQPNKGKSLSVFVNSSVVRTFIDRFVSGSATTKKLISFNNYSIDMLSGIFEGWMMGDGKENCTEGYTTSLELAEQMRYIARLIGIATNLRTTNRVCKFGETEYDSTLYTVHVCSLDNGIIYNKKNGEHYVEITSIEKVQNRNKVAFCVEVIDDKPYFQLADGLVTHNCRLRIDLNGTLYRRGGGLFGSGIKTGSIGVVTINLPRIGYIADDEEEFLDTLTGLMWKAHDSLEIKRKVLEDLSDDGLYPYSSFYLQDTKDISGGYWNNHFSTIGLIGLNDAIYNMTGDNIMSEDGHAFAIRVLEHMREVLSSIQHATGNIYNLEASPAEGASFKLALKDLKKYPGIHFYNMDESDGSAPYYTNSSQLPATNGLDLFSALDHQNDLQALYTGGTVFHTFLGESSPDIGSIKKLIKLIATNYEIPYFSITPTFSICVSHGYITGEHHFCPECGEKCEVYSRVVGFLRPLESFNDGKVSEFFERENYTVNGELT